jgi:hypothetical protein
MGFDWKNNDCLLESVTKTLESLSNDKTTTNLKGKTVSTIYYSLTKIDFNIYNSSRLYLSLENCFLNVKSEYDHSELANIIYRYLTSTIIYLVIIAFTNCYYFNNLVWESLGFL